MIGLDWAIQVGVALSWFYIPFCKMGTNGSSSNDMGVYTPPGCQLQLQKFLEIGGWSLGGGVCGGEGAQNGCVMPEAAF